MLLVELVDDVDVDVVVDGATVVVLVVVVLAFTTEMPNVEIVGTKKLLRVL